MGSEADIQWAKALRRGERLRLFPEWSMWVGLAAVTLLIAAPLVAGLTILFQPSAFAQPARPGLVIPYICLSAVLLAFVAAAWGQKINCAIQLTPNELHYWDWRRREHRVPWAQVSSISPHFLLWRITVGSDADGAPRELAIDYGADVRREAIVSELARRAGLEAETALPEGALLGSVRWHKRPPPPAPPRRRKRA